MKPGRIAVIHCFDDNYAAPAAVAFKTMLQHADPMRSYDLYVVTDSVSPRNVMRLQKVVAAFGNACLSFVAPPTDFAGLFDAVLGKAHYSKDIIVKLLLPELFPAIDKAIVTDVDCLYLGDVSEAYDRLTDECGALLGGITYFGLPCRWFDKSSQKYLDYSEQEQDCLRRGVGAGFMVYNMALMRKEGVCKTLMDFFVKNTVRLIQPEQDVLNIVCRSRILLLPPRNMVCTYLYDVLKKDEMGAWGEVLDAPVQLHYATGIKPWRNPFCTKASLWWKGLVGTGFALESLFRCLRCQVKTIAQKVSRRLGLEVLSK